MKNILLPILYAVCGIVGWNLGEFYTRSDKNKITPFVNPRSYQIQLQDTTALLYDGNSLIGRFELTGELDQLITKDNQ